MFDVRRASTLLRVWLSDVHEDTPFVPSRNSDLTVYVPVQKFTELDQYPHNPSQHI